MTNSNSESILTQDAIDVLLSSLPDEVATASDSKRFASRPGASNPVIQALRKKVSSFDTQPSVDTIIRNQVIKLAGEAAEAESAPIHASLSRISKRVDALERALERIEHLEDEITKLTNAA